MPLAIVAGGGIAGLSAAIALRLAGWRVSVHERASQLEPLGAALSLWPNATAALARLGLLDVVSAIGEPIDAMLVADRHGRPIIDPRAVAETALMVTRAALQRTLRKALGDGSLYLGEAVDVAEQDTRGVSVRFETGRTATADLLIDAGGIDSPVAQSLGMRAARFRGYGGVVALSDPVRGASDCTAREYWGGHERFGVFGLPGGCRYWFFMQNQDEDRSAPTHAEVAERATGWPTCVADAIAATPPDRLIPWSIRAKPPPTKLGVGRIICVGDAAHAMQPNLGQGACQALEDAVALCVVARSNDPQAMLPAFERLRLKRVRTIVRRAAEPSTAAHGSRMSQAAVRAVLRNLPPAFFDRMSGSVQTMPDYRL